MSWRDTYFWGSSTVTATRWVSTTRRAGGAHPVAVLERFADGSYRAEVSFWHPVRRCWVKKDKLHTMFPDSWSSEKVLRMGLEAYRQRMTEEPYRWRCRVTSPPIRGFHRRRSGPTTFYPEAERER